MSNDSSRWWDFNEFTGNDEEKDRFLDSGVGSSIPEKEALSEPENSDSTDFFDDTVEESVVGEPDLHPSTGTSDEGFEDDFSLDDFLGKPESDIDDAASYDLDMFEIDNEPITNLSPDTDEEIPQNISTSSSEWHSADSDNSLSNPPLIGSSPLPDVPDWNEVDDSDDLASEPISQSDLNRSKPEPDDLLTEIEEENAAVASRQESLSAQNLDDDQDDLQGDIDLSEFFKEDPDGNSEWALDDNAVSPPPAPSAEGGSAPSFGEESGTVPSFDFADNGEDSNAVPSFDFDGEDSSTVPTFDLGEDESDTVPTFSLDNEDSGSVPPPPQNTQNNFDDDSEESITLESLIEPYEAESTEDSKPAAPVPTYREDPDAGDDSLLPEWMSVSDEEDNEQLHPFGASPEPAISPVAPPRAETPKPSKGQFASGFGYDENPSSVTNSPFATQGSSGSGLENAFASLDQRQNSDNQPAEQTQAEPSGKFDPDADFNTPPPPPEVDAPLLAPPTKYAQDKDIPEDEVEKIKKKKNNIFSRSSSADSANKTDAPKKTKKSTPRGTTSKTMKILLAVLLVLAILIGGFAIWNFFIKDTIGQSPDQQETELSVAGDSIRLDESNDFTKKWTVHLDPKQAFSVTATTDISSSVTIIATNSEGTPIGAESYVPHPTKAIDRLVSRNEMGGEITIMITSLSETDVKVDFSILPFAGNTNQIAGTNWPVMVPANQNAIINVLSSGAEFSAEVSDTQGNIIDSGFSEPTANSTTAFHTMFIIEKTDMDQDLMVRLQPINDDPATATILVELDDDNSLFE